MTEPYLLTLREQVSAQMRGGHISPLPASEWRRSSIPRMPFTGFSIAQGDSKNRILQGLTRLSNQILSASQRQTLEALTDAHALGCFE